MRPRARVVFLALLGLLVLGGAARTLVLAEAPSSLQRVNGQELSLREGLTELAFGAAWCRPCEREVTGMRLRPGPRGRQGLDAGHRDVQLHLRAPLRRAAPKG